MNENLLKWYKWTSENPGMGFFKDELCHNLEINKDGWQSIYRKIYADRVYARSLFPVTNDVKDNGQRQQQVIEICIQNGVYPYETIDGMYIMPSYGDNIRKFIEGWVRHTKILKTLAIRATEHHWTLNGQSPITLIDEVRKIESMVKQKKE